ncbi:MAG: ribonuclease III [Chromatiales bacterium]|nr:ribonuclease III [Chromatiales bacterium]
MSAERGSSGARIGHRFGTPELLEQALTHRSAGSANNERFEFLGDALLGLFVAQALFERQPRASEGRLSRLRATLVRRETLAKLARELEIGGDLRLGPGELKSGGFRRESILADAFEALIAAVYLDAGFEAARDFVLSAYGDLIDEVAASGELKDPKTRLQEHLQASGRALPAYDLVETSGPDHRMRFVVECRLTDADLVERAPGSSRRKAEQSAAAAMLLHLGAEGGADGN